MYHYTADLLCLSFSRPRCHNCWTAIREVVSPLQPEAWEIALQPHPDKAFSCLLTEGLREGFRIGFDRRILLKPALQNMQSAHDHPEVIDAYLAKECSLGRMLGPFKTEDLTALPEYQINRFGSMGSMYTLSLHCTAVERKGVHPFCLRPAPKILNAVADALEWYVHWQGVESVFTT